MHVIPILQGNYLQCHTVDQLFENLNALISAEMSFIKNASTIFHNSTRDAVDIIMYYDEHITAIANRFGISKALMQSVLMREIRWVDLSDDVADRAVIATHVYQNSLYEFSNFPLVQRALDNFPQVPLIMREDSSTGLGQIFANTAINAHNWYYNDNPNFEPLSFQNRFERFEMWNRLRTDNYFNLEMVGMVLAHKIYLLGHNPNTTNPEQIREILARYNGTGDAAILNGIVVFEYYLLFSVFNACINR